MAAPVRVAHVDKRGPVCVHGGLCAIIGHDCVVCIATIRVQPLADANIDGGKVEVYDLPRKVVYELRKK